MNLTDFSLIRLTPATKLKPFDCGDIDLNEFFLRDSHNYQKELLAVTYIIESDNETVAFFSLLNDKLSITEFESGRKFAKYIKAMMPGDKQFRSYPAMKIGRLGISSKYKGKGLGGIILDYIKMLFITNNRTGCKFITVDAYNASTSFYEKNDFLYIPEKEPGSHTKLMYFDLRNLISEENRGMRI
jgi:hypothetical protein